MIKNSSNLLFLFSLMSGSLIAISSSSWLGSWMGLEINLLSFIPLMINTNNSLSSEASLKYFLTQALASSMLLFSIILFMMTTHMTSFLNLNTEIVNLMINSTLMLKMGAAPFHFWFPEVMDSLTWSNSLLLMTWQKLAPLVLLSYCFSFNLMTAVIILSVLIGSLGGLNQTSLRKIMAFSSINNLGWILGAMMVSENLWLMYFLFYSFLSFTMVILFNSFKLFHISQAFSMFSNYPVIKMLLFMSLLSLGGLPPFLGFLPKWLVIQSLTMNNQLLLVIIMVCLTLITLYFYIRLSYSAFMLNYWETQWNFNSTSMTLNMKLAMCFASISSLGLIMMSLFYLIY